jgi:hypothetical protein
MGEQMLGIALPKRRASSASRTMIALALLGACAVADRAAAQAETRNKVPLVCLKIAIALDQWGSDAN